MKKAVIIFFLGITCIVVNGQVPQGFNYQALARDGSGNPITGATLQVKIAILSDTLNQIVVWEELHNPVKTNSFGIFTLVIGKGVRQSGSALAFSDIDWTVASLYVKTQIYYQNTWKYLGSSKLWSVQQQLWDGGRLQQDTIQMPLDLTQGQMAITQQ